MQVVADQEKWKEENVNILTISFGTPYWAKIWLEETNSPYPLLLDPERNGYKQFDLERSVWRSWSPSTIWYYMKAIASGEKMLGDRGDANQLGGDFILDQTGKLLFSYQSKNSADRPSIELLLSAIKKK